MLNNFKASFYQNLIQDDQWKYIVDGLGGTLEIIFFAVLIDIVLGFLITMIHSACDRTYRLGFLSALCKIYLTVVHGTPVPAQLLITYFVIFDSMRIDKVLVAITASDTDSDAYAAEIFQGGIMPIDNDQFKAGRSLGFDYTQTMIYIIIPQAFKNVLPALCNEFIMLLKETSMAGYIAIQDLTKGADIIRDRTYSAFIPLITAVIIYFMTVIVSTCFMQKLERRLGSNDH